MKKERCSLRKNNITLESFYMIMKEEKKREKCSSVYLVLCDVNKQLLLQKLFQDIFGSHVNK